MALDSMSAAFVRDEACMGVIVRRRGMLGAIVNVWSKLAIVRRYGIQGDNS